MSAVRRRLRARSAVRGAGVGFSGSGGSALGGSEGAGEPVVGESVVGESARVSLADAPSLGGSEPRVMEPTARAPCAAELAAKHASMRIDVRCGETSRET